VEQSLYMESMRWTGCLLREKAMKSSFKEAGEAFVCASLGVKNMKHATALTGFEAADLWEGNPNAFAHWQKDEHCTVVLRTEWRRATSQQTLSMETLLDVAENYCRVGLSTDSSHKLLSPV